MNTLSFANIRVDHGHLACVVCKDRHRPSEQELDTFQMKATVQWVRDHSRCVPSEAE